jgi:hypothetical protein
MNAILTGEQMDVLRRLDGCTVANANQELIRLCQSEDFSLDKLRSALGKIHR